MKRYVFRFLRKDARLSQDFKVVGSSFQMMGAATEKARLPRFSLVLGIIVLFLADLIVHENFYCNLTLASINYYYYYCHNYCSTTTNITIEEPFIFAQPPPKHMSQTFRLQITCTEQVQVSSVGYLVVAAVIHFWCVPSCSPSPTAALSLRADSCHN